MIGDLLLLGVLLIPPAVVIWYIVWFTIEACWWSQKRWVVWYPPEEALRIIGEYRADWSVPMSYQQARDYASIFKGKVYRVR